MRNKFTLCIIAIALLISFTLSSCGASTVKGDLTPYSNGDKSFSIQLPTSSDKDWVVNEESAGTTLDVSNGDENINIKVQCLSKQQAAKVATDLDSYIEYSKASFLGGIADDMKLKDSKVDLPEFVTNSQVQSYSLTSGGTSYKGILAFMESDSCYYTYLILAVDEAYSNNKSALQDTIASLQEVTTLTTDEAMDEE